MSARAEQSRIASATSATGFTVGCSAKRLPSSVQRPKELPPGYRHTLLRFAPEAAELDVVAVLVTAMFEDKDELVLAAIQRSAMGMAYFFKRRFDEAAAKLLLSIQD